jgi:hypothetical protein
VTLVKFYDLYYNDWYYNRVYATEFDSLEKAQIGLKICKQKDSESVIEEVREYS